MINLSQVITDFGQKCQFDLFVVAGQYSCDTNVIYIYLMYNPKENTFDVGYEMIEININRSWGVNQI